MVRHCHLCEFTTKLASTMSMHISMTHTKNKKHECPICHDKFAEKTQLQHHFVNNHCDPDILCGFPGCALLFKNTTTQKMHYVRHHISKALVYTSSFMKGYKTCLTCNTYLKCANMMYHIAQCSPESPFCTNVAAIEKKKMIDAVDPLDELMELDDLDEDFFASPVKIVVEEEEEEALVDIIGRVLS